MINQDQLGMLLRDYSFAYLGGMGRVLSKIFKGVDKDLNTACMNIHSEVYFSMVSLVALLASTIPFTVLILSLANIIPLQAMFGINPVAIRTNYPRSTNLDHSRQYCVA